MKVILGTDTMHHCWIRRCFCQLKKKVCWAWTTGSPAFHLKKQDCAEQQMVLKGPRFPLAMRREGYLWGVYLFPFAASATDKTEHLWRACAMTWSTFQGKEKNKLDKSHRYQASSYWACLRSFHDPISNFVSLVQPSDHCSTKETSLSQALPSV